MRGRKNGNHHFRKELIAIPDSNKPDFKKLDCFTYSKYQAMKEPESEEADKVTDNRFPEAQRRAKRKPPAMKHKSSD